MQPSVLPFAAMRPAALFPILALLLLQCSGSPAQNDHQSEWRDVLRQKKVAESPAASVREKQLYADSLSAFLRRHPEHGRAREVYQRIQLEFANDLASIGRHQDAIRFYRAVLNADPRNEEARRGLAESVDKLAVSRVKLLSIEVGMSRGDVARVLGKPIPGWVVRNDRDGTDYEAWYYRTTTGGVAAVHFRDGEVFAAEEKSDSRAGV